MTHTKIQGHRRAGPPPSPAAAGGLLAYDSGEVYEHGGASQPPGCSTTMTLPSGR